MTKMDKIYVGDTEVKKMYRGENLIFSVPDEHITKVENKGDDVWYPTSEGNLYGTEQNTEGQQGDGTTFTKN